MKNIEGLIAVHGDHEPPKRHVLIPPLSHGMGDGGPAVVRPGEGRCTGSSTVHVLRGHQLSAKGLLVFVWLILFLVIELSARADLDHFYWSAVPSTAQVGEPFFVTLRARGPGNSAYTNFNGTVRVTEMIPAQSPGLLITEVQTVNTNRVELSNVAAAPLDVSGWRVAFYDSASWPAPKAVFALPAGTVCPGYGVFEIRASGLSPGAYPTFYTGVSLTWYIMNNNPVAVLLLDAQGAVVDFFCAGGAYPPYVAVPLSITEAAWSGPPAAVISSYNPALTYQRRGYADHHNAADWSIATNSFGALNPRMQLPFVAAATSVDAIPSSVTLTNGKWCGQLVVSVPGTNAFLRADNGEGLPGDSSAFTVLNLPSLSVRVPHEAYKASAGLVGQGEVFIPQPLASNLPVTLSSS